ncbi:MAG: tetratricopeptide repeat protein [Thermoguttaceae bacterium]
MPTFPSKVERAVVRWIFSYLTIALLAIAVVLPRLAIAFLSASGHVANEISTPSPENGRAAPPVVGSSELPSLPHARQDAELSSTPVPPQPDREVAVVAEIDALEKESIEIAQTLIYDFPRKSGPLGLAGMVYSRRGQTAKALEFWERALKRNPNRPDLYDAMATIALRKEEYEEAVELCRKGLGTSTQIPHLYYQLVEALNALGRTEESVNELQIAIRLFPENGEFHCQMGKTNALLNEYEKAKISYEMAVKLQPRSAPSHYGLAVVCARLGMEHESERELEQYRNLQPERLQAQLGRSDRANDVLDGRRNLAMTCCEVGTVYLDNGRPGKAEPLLRRGAAVDPESIGCRIQLAQLLCSTNRVPESVSVVRELIEIEPENVNFHLRLAMIYAQLEQLDEALKAVKKALELAPGNEECRRFLEQLQAKM